MANRNPPGRPKGTPKTGGRKAGTPNKATVAAKVAAAALVDDPDYRTKLRERLIAGKLAPAVEVMLWHYAHGRPTLPVDLGGRVTLAQLLANAADVEDG